MDNNGLSPVLQQILKTQSNTPLDIAGRMQDLKKENEKMKEEIQGAEIADINPDMVMQLNSTPKKPFVRKNKIGRNDLCPCGSGKKYKNCCLKTGKYEE